MNNHSFIHTVNNNYNNTINNQNKFEQNELLIVCFIYGFVAWTRRVESFIITNIQNVIKTYYIM